MKFDWKTEYETLDEIPEECRGGYEEKDGKFQIVRALSKTQLENAYKKEQERRKIAEDKAKAIPDDIEANKLSEMLEELEDLRQLKESGEFDEGNREKLEELVGKRVETERKKFERDNAKLKAQLDEANTKLGETSGKLKTVSLETQARELAAKYKIASHSLDDALFHVTKSFDLDDEGNIVDRTDAGRTLEDWFDETVPNKPGWTFDPKTSGSGAHGGSGGHGGKRTYKREEVSQWATENPTKAKEAMEAVKKGDAQLVD